MKLQNPMRRWEVVAGFCVACDAKVAVEIGCKEGKLTQYLLANVPRLYVHAVDPWENAPKNEGESYEDWNWDEIKAQFCDRVQPYVVNGRARMLQTTSLEAAERFEDESVDVVFIDGAHDYENVRADIAAWWPKVKPSGYLCGHDYQHKFPGVHRAVAEHFNLLRVAIMADSVWAVPKTGGLKL